jgi:PAS domain S-box-containing protein
VVVPAAEDRFRRLLELAPDAMILVDRAGRMTLVNSQTQRLFGYSEAELIGQPVDMLVPDAVRAGHAAHRAAYAATPRTRAMGSGLDLAGRRKDGTEFPVEISLAPMETEDGLLVMSAIRDVTERRRGEDAVRASEAKFRRLLELAPDAIVIVDRDGRMTLVNSQAQRLFGYAEEEMLGQPVELLVPDRVRAGHVAHRARYMAEPRTRPMGSGLALAGRRKDGGEFPVEISLAPMDSEDGPLVISVIRDVSDRRAVESQINALNADLERRVAELAAVNRELESFSYSVSHDLRAPLRSIDGFSQALLEEYGDILAGEGQDYLRRVRAATQRMGELIDDLLNLARVTRREMRSEPVDLSALAHTIAAQLQRNEPDRTVTVSVQEGLVARGDPQLLRLVLENLLGNAWKFTGKSPAARIDFGMTTQNGAPVYYVRDNGVGFDMAYSEKLFGAFQRLHAMTEFPGTGIGLATVQRIVTRHGGRVWAEAAVGRGATFYFTL